MKTYSNEEGAEMEELRFNSVFVLSDLLDWSKQFSTAGAAKNWKSGSAYFWSANL